MIKITKGNLLKAPAEALVNTVNTVGVMGKGVALQFRQAYPEMYRAYQKACDAKDVQLRRGSGFRSWRFGRRSALGSSTSRQKAIGNREAGWRILNLVLLISPRPLSVSGFVPSLCRRSAVETAAWTGRRFTSESSEPLQICPMLKCWFIHQLARPRPRQCLFERNELE